MESERFPNMSKAVSGAVKLRRAAERYGRAGGEKEAFSSVRASGFLCSAEQFTEQAAAGYGPSDVQTVPPKDHAA